MKLTIFNTARTEVGKRELPVQFTEPIRTDLIKRAVVTIESNMRQPYGADPMAGKRASAELSRRRHKYRGSYGQGISRVPRKILSRRGTRMNWVGAFAPGTVKGRRAHPPKAEKTWSAKLNRKERRKAIRSAMTATMIREIALQRGHAAPENYPFLLDTKAESIDRTKDVQALLEKLLLGDELERVKEKKVRAGRGKMRGRKYRRKIGPLIVVGDSCNLLRSGKNIAGIDVVRVDRLNAKLLAPGAKAGRLTLFTENAIDMLEKKQLFMDIERPKTKEKSQEKEKKAEKKAMKPKKAPAKPEKTLADKDKKPGAKPAPADVKQEAGKKDEKKDVKAAEDTGPK